MSQKTRWRDRLWNPKQLLHTTPAAPDRELSLRLPTRPVPAAATHQAPPASLSTLPAELLRQILYVELADFFFAESYTLFFPLISHYKLLLSLSLVCHQLRGISQQLLWEHVFVVTEVQVHKLLNSSLWRTYETHWLGIRADWGRMRAGTAKKVLKGVRGCRELYLADFEVDHKVKAFTASQNAFEDEILSWENLKGLTSFRMDWTNLKSTRSIPLFFSIPPPSTYPLNIRSLNILSSHFASASVWTALASPSLTHLSVSQNKTYYQMESRARELEAISSLLFKIGHQLSHLKLEFVNYLSLSKLPFETLTNLTSLHLYAKTMDDIVEATSRIPSSAPIYRISIIPGDRWSNPVEVIQGLIALLNVACLKNLKVVGLRVSHAIQIAETDEGADWRAEVWRREIQQVSVGDLC